MALVEVFRRTVQDFGILKLDEINDPLMLSVSAWTHVQIWLVLRRVDENSYKNLDWNPDQSMYGRVTIAASDDLGFTNPPIIAATLMKYQMQLVYEWQNDAALTNFLIQCGTQKIMSSIFNLGTALGLQPFVISDLPECKREICPASIVRVNCDKEHVIDIVVLAENAFALLDPQEFICTDYIPIPESNDVPRPGDSDNSLTPQDGVPDENARPDPPYDPFSGDEGESPLRPPAPPLPGQFGRVRYSGLVRVCGETVDRPLTGVSQSFNAPATLTLVPSGLCTQQNNAQMYNLHVEAAGGQSADLLTSMTTVPQYVLEYYTP